MKRLLLPVLALVLAAASPAVSQDDRQLSLQGSVAASQVMGLPVQDAQGQDVGRVVDLALDQQEGRVAAVIAEIPQVANDQPSHLTVPWQDATLAGNAVELPVPLAEADAYRPVQPSGPVASGQEDVPETGLAWKLTNLIDDYAVLRGGVGYGNVRDMLFDPQDGRIEAVVVVPATRLGAEAPATAHRFDPEAWTPQTGVYSLPQAEEDVAEMPPFTYQSLERQAD